ncbi:MAG TPA: hypothetical protein VKT82_06015 [Ktedonobacterales bacterium]|nr:hypothetical protein [Ktedonobacterales bacterium]
MENIPPRNEPLVAHSYVAGTPVLDAHGEKVGMVAEPETRGNYLVVQKGWLFTSKLYIPLSEIHAQDANGIYLNLTKEQLKDDQWKVPPGGGAAVEAAPPSMLPPTTVPGQEPDPLANGILPGPLPADPLSNS